MAIVHTQQNGTFYWKCQHMIMIWISLSFTEWQVWDGQVTVRCQQGSQGTLCLSRDCVHAWAMVLFISSSPSSYIFFSMSIMPSLGSFSSSPLDLWKHHHGSELSDLDYLHTDIQFLHSESYLYTHLFSLSLAFFAAFSPEVTYGQVFPVTLFFSISNTVSVLICSKNEFMLQIKLKIYMYELYSKVFSMTTHFQLTFKWLN